MTSLRDRLRADTAARHDRVDRAYSKLDLTQSEDLRTFLRAQRSVLLSVRCYPGRHAAAAQDLASRMVIALEADLVDLDGGPVLPEGERRLDATAMLYMLLGSSLGTRVLHRRWLGTTDFAARAAGRYLALTPPLGAWRHLCEDLAQGPSEGADADRIVQDAGELFDLHLAALEDRTLLFQGVLHA